MALLEFGRLRHQASYHMAANPKLNQEQYFSHKQSLYVFDMINNIQIFLASHNIILFAQICKTASPYSVAQLDHSIVRETKL